MNDFAAFALFYDFATLDSISNLYGHQIDQRNDKVKSIRTGGRLVSTSLFSGQNLRPEEEPSGVKSATAIRYPD